MRYTRLRKIGFYEELSMQVIDFNLLIFISIIYLFASIPFGLLLTRFFNLGDIRKIGSGNIGATNVLRTGNKKAAALTLFFDALKGAVPVIMCEKLFPGWQYFAGFLAVFAHIFSVFLKFRGGKGIATAFGVYLGWNPILALTLAVIWLAVFKMFKISSLSALVASASAPLIAYLLNCESNLVFYSVLTAILILFTHRSNILRIIRKEESSISLHNR